MTHIHLDLIGGLAGDMFIAAMLDCYPAEADSLAGVIESAGFSDLVTLKRTDANDGTLTGTHFTVDAAADAEGHHHRHYSEIRKIIESSSLAEGTAARALDIFHRIAVVEAEIHGKSVESVAFHEVGAWDSIADILCAAHLIETTGATFSVSRIPIGRGRVKTAHGMLPVPAPATARLLEGFAVVDDGIEGERVTPTGAAILAHLAPAEGPPRGAVLRQTGYGFGTKTFPGLSNVVRAVMYETSADHGFIRDEVTELAFEIDDQTAEEIAVALESLRETEGVLYVVQYAAFGKKGRQAVSVRLLVTPGFEESVLPRCFDLTTTLGVRQSTTGRAILRREQVTLSHDGRDYRVKIAFRPGGPTAKVEMDDLLNPADRAAIEALALSQLGST